MRPADSKSFNARPPFVASFRDRDDIAVLDLGDVFDLVGIKS